jgi:Fic family protein
MTWGNGMYSFQPDRLNKLEIPVATAWLLASCMEARGKQDLWMSRKPELLEALHELAVIQSVESSNRIEGVTVEAERLRPLLINREKPRDRAEEELSGYRKALDWIDSRKRAVPVRPDTILRLHALTQGGFSGDAGKWKDKDNEIVEIKPDGRRVIRFKPMSAKETPEAVEALCLSFDQALRDEVLPPLMAVASFVFDFLCIHPFRDGNGRVSRLLTQFLLKQQGFVVGSYVSLERLVEESKETYYDVLKRCSKGWHEASHDLLPWWNYFLSILNLAYGEFADSVETLDTGTSKGELVRMAILRQDVLFTLGELRLQLPSVSVQLIKKVLMDMKERGELALEGRGRGARWSRII